MKNSKIVLNLDALFVVAMDLIYAIQHMEQKGIVHNNISTSSVLIGRGLRVRMQKCIVLYEEKAAVERKQGKYEEKMECSTCFERRTKKKSGPSVHLDGRSNN